MCVELLFRYRTIKIYISLFWINFCRYIYLSPFFCVQLRSDSFQKQIRINRQSLSVGSCNLAKEIGLPLTGWHTFRRSSADNRRW